MRNGPRGRCNQWSVVGSPQACMGSVVKQAKMIKQASQNFAAEASRRQLYSGGFPGARERLDRPRPRAGLVAQTIMLRSHSRIRSRWFVAHQGFFMKLAILIVIIFVIDILVIIVFFWGAIFGIGVMGRNPVCDLNTSDPAIVVTAEETVTYPPMTCRDFNADGSCKRSDYVANVCNLNQWMFNNCIKVIMILLTYINVLPIPWRVAIGVDAWGDVFLSHGKHEPPGTDFHGRLARHDDAPPTRVTAAPCSLSLSLFSPLLRAHLVLADRAYVWRTGLPKPCGSTSHATVERRLHCSSTSLTLVT